MRILTFYATFKSFRWFSPSNAFKSILFSFFISGQVLHDRLKQVKYGFLDDYVSSL